MTRRLCLLVLVSCGAACGFDVPLGAHDAGVQCSTVLFDDVALDPTFGTCGVVRLDVDHFNNITFNVDGLAVDAFDRPVFVGTAGQTNASDFVAVRLLTSGALDPSFGDAGLARVDGTPRDFGLSIEVEPQGTIALAGAGKTDAGESISMMARLREDGSLDTTFAGGIVDADIGATHGLCNGLGRAVDGTLYCSGQTWGATAGPTNLQVLARRTDGSALTTFGSFGRAAYDFTGSDDFGGAIAVLPDGTLLVAGESWNGANYDFALLKLTAQGEADSSFGTQGRLLVDIAGEDDACTSLARVSNGDLWCVGQSGASGALMRLNAAGGVSLKKAMPTFTSINALVEVSNGRLLIAGSAHTASARDAVAFQLLNGDGSEASALTTFDLSADDDGALSLRFDSQGRLIVYGVAARRSADNDFFVMRLAPTGHEVRLGQALQCSMQPELPALLAIAAWWPRWRRRRQR